MVVVGVSPGIRSLAYVVAVWYPGDPTGHLVDADVLRGARTSVRDNLTTLIHKGRVHHLILDVVFERHTPTLLALAPHNGDEPAAHIAVMQQILDALATFFRVETRRWDTNNAVLADLSVKGDPKEVVRSRYDSIVPVGRSKSLLWAAVAAVAAADLKRAGEQK